jgi:hypothetical protein
MTLTLKKIFIFLVYLFGGTFSANIKAQQSYDLNGNPYAFTSLKCKKHSLKNQENVFSITVTKTEDDNLLILHWTSCAALASAKKQGVEATNQFNVQMEIHIKKSDLGVYLTDSKISMLAYTFPNEIGYFSYIKSNQNSTILPGNAGRVRIQSANNNIIEIRYTDTNDKLEAIDTITLDDRDY